MSGSRATYDLRYFKLGQAFPFRDLPTMPTVCLLVADKIEPPYEYGTLVTDLMAIGCRFFMTWGAAAGKFEDVLDETIVALSIERNDDTFAATTAHRNEPAHDVAHFLLKAALPGEQKVRCCIGFAGNVSSGREDELRLEIRKIVGN